MMESVTFLLAHLSLLSCVILAYVTAKKTQRSRVRTAFFTMILIMFIWNVGTLLEMYYRLLSGYTNMLFVQICYFGICFIPIAILLLGITISHPHDSLSPALAALLIVPCISMIIICTNEYHRLFFVNFSVYSSEAVYGPYYYFHSAYSYGCILVGIVYLLSFSVRNSGIFSRQSLIIVIGILIPLAANVLFSFAIVPLSFSINASMFTVTILSFAVAFLKYDFLMVVPMALRRVVDLISDAYLVIDTRYNIVDFNRAMLGVLPPSAVLTHGMGLEELMVFYRQPGLYQRLVKLHVRSVMEDRTVSLEYRLDAGGEKRFYDVEITPVFQKRMLIGSIILLKDITQAKRDLEMIRDTQAIMIERERLASLGQMVGGIAHNLKTPIMSIAGGIEAIRDLAVEYRESVDDEAVTPEDHREIAAEIEEWLHKMQTHCAYISDMISTVKGQAVRLNFAGNLRFTLDEFLKRVDLLMKHELKKYHCILRTDIRVDVNTEIDGDVNSLVQIFDNLIINAIHAYEGKTGVIDLSIVMDEEKKLVFTLRDYGCGIPEDVLARLFREMVTTKGKNGTGLGLYLSSSTIKGHFNGNMEVQSKLGEGSAFTISIPAHGA